MTFLSLNKSFNLDDLLKEIEWKVCVNILLNIDNKAKCISDNQTVYKTLIHENTAGFT